MRVSRAQFTAVISTGIALSTLCGLSKDPVLCLLVAQPQVHTTLSESVSVSIVIKVNVMKQIILLRLALTATAGDLRHMVLCLYNS